VNITSLRRPAALGAALALGVSLTACGAANEEPATGSDSGETSSLSGTLNGGGASSQEAAQNAWRAGFQEANPEVTVNYDPIGSGGGREQFISGGFPFAGSDSYLDNEEGELDAATERCDGEAPVEVPNYVSPIAVVYNLEGVDNLQLSAKTAAGIFDGKIKTWDDAAIKAENPDAKLPSDRIVPVHRSDGSGTTDNLTQWLSKAGEGAWTSEPGSDWPLKGGEGAEGTSGVIEAVKSGKGTIGYADESQAGDLSTAAIKVGDAYVKPTAEGATKVIEVSKVESGRGDNDMAIEIDRTTTEPGAYPLTLASYVIACPTYTDKNKAALVKGYLTYLLSTDGQAAAAKTAGSAPLPSKLGGDAVAIADQIAAK
jgi:phosphate transport system substrate-binding protein